MTALAGLLIMAGCDALEGEYSGGHHRDTGRTTGEGESSFLLSAVSFPDGYDWRRDSLAGKVDGARILVLKNLDTIMQIPCKAGVSIDPDMHHLIDGDLFTEGCEGNVTVIGKNGVELMRYDGREMLRGILIDGKDIYTLGQNRSSEGFALRKNGEVIYARESGRIMGNFYELGYSPGGALYKDSTLCFSFWKTNVTDGRKEWFLYDDGGASRVELRGSFTRLFDIRKRGGVIYSIAGGDGSRPVMFADCDSLLRLGTEGPEAEDYRFFCKGDKLCIYGSYNYDWNGHRRDSRREVDNLAVWEQDGTVRIFPSKGKLYVSSDSLMYVPDKQLPSGYSMQNYNCGQFVGGKLLIALSPSADTLTPAILAGGKLRSLNINGYLSGLAAVSD